ncbi:MAG TPA: hypothetical protein PLC07_01155 [Bacillota bacterium]|nr:hypothetical protein [Bacillota bacterium]
MNRKRMLIFYGLLSLFWLVMDSQCLAKLSGQMFGMFDITSVTWETPYREKGVTYYPGWAEAEFGKFRFLACIDRDGRGSLVTVQALGGAEVPPVQQRLFVAVDGQKSVIFQLKLPLFGSKQPARLQPVVAVPSDQLFRVLPKPAVPELPKGYHKAATIRWSKVQVEEEFRYIRGSVNTSAGHLVVFWSKIKGQEPQLMLGGNSGRGARLHEEQPLYIWDQPGKGITVIFQERHPLSHQKGISYLWPLAMVKTDALIKGMQQVL